MKKINKNVFLALLIGVLSVSLAAVGNVSAAGSEQTPSGAKSGVDGGKHMSNTNPNTDRIKKHMSNTNPNIDSSKKHMGNTNPNIDSGKPTMKNN